MGEENHGLRCVSFYKFCQNSTSSPLHGVKWTSLSYLTIFQLLDYFTSLVAIVTIELLQLWWLSQVVGPGFEPGLVLEFFCFPASRSWVQTSPSIYFFCNERVAENIPVLSGRLVYDGMWLAENWNRIQFTKLKTRVRFCRNYYHCK